MILDRQAKLFVGFKLEGKLRDVYDAANHSGYVGEEGKGTYLTTLESNGFRYLGKVVDGGLATDRVDDVTRNVLSILGRMALGHKLPSALAIFALSAAQVT